MARFFVTNCNIFSEKARQLNRRSGLERAGSFQLQSRRDDRLCRYWGGYTEIPQRSTQRIHFTTNAHGGNMEGAITLFGEKGIIKIGGEYLNELEYQDIADHTISGLEESTGANDYGTYKGSMSNHGKVYENLVQVFRNEKQAAAVGYEGLKTVEIIEKIYDAVESAPTSDRSPLRAVG